MRALVTGITGFVGGHLAEHLLSECDEVVGCARRVSWPDELSYLQERICLKRCDLCDPQDAARLFENDEYEVVCHLAGMANPRACQADPELASQANVEATRNLYDAIVHSGQTPRVLFVSTSYVYGQPQPNELPVGIHCTIRTEHPYAATKWEAERQSMHYAEQHGLDIVRVRPFNHTGPRQSTSYAIPHWANQVARIERGCCEPVLRVGSLDSRRDYTDVRDVVRAYRLLPAMAPPKTVYNLGSGKEYSGWEILQELQALTRRSFGIQTDPARLRTAEVHEIVADAEPLHQLTGWQPRIDLKTTLRDTLDFWRGRP